jgi:hypothetical protein
MRLFNTLNQDFLRGLRIVVGVIVSMALLAGIGGLPAHDAQASPDIVITHYSGDARASYLVFGEIVGMRDHHFEPPDTVATAQVQFGSGAGQAAAFQSALGINAVEASANFGSGRQARFDGSTFFSVTVRNTTRRGIPITFKFVINGGELRIENFAGFDDPLQSIGAHVFASIDIFGISGGGTWRFPLQLTKDGNGNPILLNNFDGFGIKDDFGVGTPNVRGPFFDGDAVFVTIDRFEAGFPIGVLPEAHTHAALGVYYNMAARVLVEGSAPIGGLAAIGDPFSLSSGGGGEDVGAQLFINGMDLGQFPFGEPSPVVPVAIDIKPKSDRNSINPHSSGVVPVAILTTSVNDGDSVDFDAATVDPLSVAFGPNGALAAKGKGHIQDADGDGDDDLVLHFRTQETGLQCGDTQAVLTGVTFDGQSIEGVDVINTAGC